MPIKTIIFKKQILIFAIKNIKNKSFFFNKTSFHCEVISSFFIFKHKLKKSIKLFLFLVTKNPCINCLKYFLLKKKYLKINIFFLKENILIKKNTKKSIIANNHCKKLIKISLKFNGKK